MNHDVFRLNGPGPLLTPADPMGFASPPPSTDPPTTDPEATTTSSNPPPSDSLDLDPVVYRLDALGLLLIALLLVTVYGLTRRRGE